MKIEIKFVIKREAIQNLQPTRNLHLLKQKIKFSLQTLSIPPTRYENLIKSYSKPATHNKKRDTLESTNNFTVISICYKKGSGSYSR